MKLIKKLWIASGMLGSNPMQSIASNFQFWSDGTTSGGQLLDKSGNNRHATLTSNLVTLADTSIGDTAWFQSGGQAPSVNSLITSDLSPAFPAFGITAGTHTMRVRYESVTGFYLHRCQSLILRNGDSVTVTFRAKKVISSSITFTMRMGNGSTNGVSSTLSSATYLIDGSQAVGSWGLYRATFTNTAPGGLAHLFFNGGASGTPIEFLVDKDVTVTVNGESNNCFVLPQDSSLKSIDTLNHFYTSTGVSRSIRGDSSWNAFSKKIYCGGSMKYVLLSSNPTIETHKIICENFELPSFYFSSCPIRLTVGSGKTYATYEDARAAATGVGDYLNRTCIDLYDNLSVSVYAGYTVTVGTNKVFMAINKSYVCVSGRLATSGRVSVSATKEASSSDSIAGGTEVLSMTTIGTGVECIDFTVLNGGYLWHHDFTGMANGLCVVNDCTFESLGAQEIFDYRTNNLLAQPAVPLSFNVQAGGMHNGHILKVFSSTLKGTRPYTWQDVAATTGGTAYYHNCNLISMPIYDVIDNPTSIVKENIRLTSSGVGSTVIYNTRCTKNSSLNEIGAVKSIFLTEL